MYNRKHYETEAIETKKQLLREGKVLEANNITVPVKVAPDDLYFIEGNGIDDNIVILRYMNYDKFQYLIENASLYMSAPTHFLQDSSEGYLVAEVENFYDSLCEKVYDFYVPKLRAKGGYMDGVVLSGIRSVDLDRMKHRWRQIYKHNIKRFFVSCWTERLVDQDNMWRAYIPDETKRERGVVIKTTIGKLKLALKNCNGMFRIQRVKYVDLDTVRLDSVEDATQGIWATCAYMLGLKDLCYEDDHEIRIISDSMMSNTTQWHRKAVMMIFGVSGFDYGATPARTYINAPLDLGNFIDEIIVSPTSKDGFIQEIQNFLNANHLENVNIVKSRVNKKRPICGD